MCQLNFTADVMEVTSRAGEQPALGGTDCRICIIESLEDKSELHRCHLYPLCSVDLRANMLSQFEIIVAWSVGCVHCDMQVVWGIIQYV